MLLLLPAAQAATIAVPGDYPKISVALKHASDGDTIEVAAGEYSEDLSIEVDVTLDAPDGATLVGAHTLSGSAVRLVGLTFTGTSTYASSGLHITDSAVEIEGCAFVENTTTYGDTGAIYAKDSTLLVEDSAFERNRGYGLVGGLYLESGALELRQVSFDGDASTYGHSAVYAKDAEVVLQDCSFTGHQGYVGGGAVTVEGSEDLVAEGLHFEQTSTTYGTGGALYVKGAAVSLLDVSVRDSRGYSSGGGLYLEAEAVSVEGLRVHTASCTYGSGGGLYVKAGVAALEGLWLQDVSCQSSGGGLYVEAQDLDLRRSVVLSATATYGSGTAWIQADELLVQNNDFLEGGALYLQSGGRGLFQNNIVSSSSVQLQQVDELGWNAWSGGVTPVPGEGDLESECGFVSYPDDLHLAEGSPCIDAGNPEVLDQDGSPSDIGAFGPYPEEPVDTGDTGQADSGGGDSVGELPDDTGPSADDSGGTGPGLDQDEVALEPFCGCGFGGSGAWILLGVGAFLLRRRRA